MIMHSKHLGNVTEDTAMVGGTVCQTGAAARTIRRFLQMSQDVKTKLEAKIGTAVKMETQMYRSVSFKYVTAPEGTVQK